MSLPEVLAAGAVFVLLSGLVFAVAKARTAAINCTVIALLTMAAAGITYGVQERSDRQAAKEACLDAVAAENDGMMTRRESLIREAEQAAGIEPTTADDC